MSSHALQDNFDDAAAGLHQAFITQSRPQSDDDKFNVSGFEGGGGGSNRAGGKGRGGGRGNYEGQGGGRGRGKEAQAEAVAGGTIASANTEEMEMMSKTNTTLQRNMQS
jgi:hypothetical protein